MLTPTHLFRQLDPSWFLNGQTTSLLGSDAEKEPVNEVLGGMPGACGSGGCLQPSAFSKDQLQVYLVTMQFLRDQLA